jgi:hypothetical protein
MDFRTLIRKPSAYLPVGMSLAALATVLVHVAFFGIVRQADEGAAAHVFQLLLAAEVPVVAYFAGRWLPKAPKATLAVLAVQAAAVAAALAPVFILGM